MEFWDNGGDGITLLDGESNLILSIKKKGDKIRFRERCDDYFNVKLSPAEAKAALQEAIDYIDSLFPAHITVISAIEGDPGYSNWLAIHDKSTIEILLDGVVVDAVVSAEECRPGDKFGRVTFSKKDDCGDIKLGASIETKKGDVKINIKEPK